ncbi:hypothetical protein ACFL96_00580 [Thermoproteota archaeon]
MGNFTKRILIIAVLACLTFSQTVLAIVPSLNIMLQEKLYSEFYDSLLDGDIPATFSFLSEADELWSKSYPLVSFAQGNFTVTFSIDELPIALFSSPNVYLQIQMPNETVTVSMTSVPYAIKALTADDVRRVTADTIYGVFTNTVTINAPLFVWNGLHVDTVRGRVGISQITERSQLDVSGNINADSYFLNGVPFEDTLAWQQSVDTGDIYTLEIPVGISTATPNAIFSLDVRGTVNAEDYLLRGERLPDALDWKRSYRTDGPTFDIYTDKPGGKVGIGTAVPKVKLDLRGAFIVGSTTSENEGTIRFTGTDFQGYFTEWKSLTSIQGNGERGEVTLWRNAASPSGQNHFDSSAGFYWDIENNALGIGTKSPQASLDIRGYGLHQDLLHVYSTQNASLLVVTNSGNVGVGTPSPDYKVQVRGIVDAEELLVNGKPLRSIVVTGEYWLLCPDDSSIYYSRGFVGIGTNEPNNPLEISQGPNFQSPYSLADPALTLDNAAVNVQYTMGVATQYPDLFRVEKGTELGQEFPLFVLKDRFLGIGVQVPSANLTVSGNEGIILSGKYFNTTILEGLDAAIQQELENTQPISPTMHSTLYVEGPGARFLWYPPLAAFRTGVIDTNAPLGGADWDFINLGKFSMGMGYNNVVSGNVSSVLGGQNNIAGGAYAAVLGGRDNHIVGGTYFGPESFATWVSGRYATSQHRGTFVWSDGRQTVTTNSENQFLIYALNGVGINTNQTYLSNHISALTIKPSTPTQDVFRAFSFPVSKNMVTITNTGNVLIGTQESTTANLVVMNGGVGIGTTNALADLVISNPTGDNHIFMALGEPGLPSAAIVISTTGNVHIGSIPRDIIQPSSDIPMKGFLRIYGGSISAFEYAYDTGEVIATEGVVVWYWAYPSPFITPNIETTPNIFFISGNVGIGSSSPNSLVTLGDNSSNTDHRPMINFDYNGVDQYAVGMLNDPNSPLRFGGTSAYSGSEPAMTLYNSNVGFGIVQPLAAVHAKDAIIENLTVDSYFGPRSLELGNANILTLMLGGIELYPSDVPWVTKTNPDMIYYDITGTKFVGIGLTNPAYNLEVTGTLNINSNGTEPSLTVSDWLMVLNDLELPGLYFKDLIGEDLFLLFVRNQRLYIYGRGIETCLSDILTYSPYNDASAGYIVMDIGYETYDSDLVLAESPIWWSGYTKTMLVTSNVLVEKSYLGSSGFTVDNIINLGTETMNDAVYLQSSIDHGGLLAYSKNFTQKTLEVRIASTNFTTTPAALIPIRAVDISINQPSDQYFAFNGRCYGLVSDVSEIAIQEVGNKGRKYAALFFSGATGNVGIGTTPLADLDVKGTVYATNFQISDGIHLTTINVTNALSILEYGKVGIGTTQPSTTLEVVGDIQAQELRSLGLNGYTLDINDGDFIVNELGKVGMGITQPTAMWELNKLFSAISTRDFFFERIVLTLDSSVSQNIGGLDIAIHSSENIVDRRMNYLGDYEKTDAYLGTGFHLDLSNLEIEDDYTLSGIYVSVSRNYDPLTATGDRRYAAIFRGGNVGIGTTQPEYPLEVRGTIHATNAPDITFNNQQQAASFNYLYMNNDISINENAEMANVYVGDSLYVYGKLVMSNELNLASVTLNVQTNIQVDEWVSVNVVTKVKVLEVLNQTTANTAVFNNGLGIGTDSLEPNTLSVANTMKGEEVIITQSVNPVSLIVNDTALVTIEKNVGIGLTNPYSELHVQIKPGFSFISTNNTTWGTVTIQNPTVTQNYAAGIVFQPNIEYANTIGSGLLALRSTDASQTGSHLVFVTDPASGLPRERMRITSTGNVGIGTKTPLTTAVLDLAGSGIVQETLFVDSTVLVGVINGLDNLQVATDTPLIIIPTMNILNSAETNSWGFYPVNQPVPSPDYGTLYATNLAPDVGDLYYTTVLTGNIVISGNIVSTFSVTGLGNVIPYFNNQHRLTETGKVFWSTANINATEHGTLLIQASMDDALINTGNVTSSNVVSPYQAESIAMTFKRRITTAPTTFIGYDIFSATDNLREDECIVGVKVDVTDLRTTSSAEIPGSPVYSGIKYAALFSTDNVGIIPTFSVGTLFRPTASLHIASGSMLVTNRQTAVTDDPVYLFVSDTEVTGGVRIGGLEQIPIPISVGQLTVIPTNDQTAFWLLNDNDETLLFAHYDTSVGIGISEPQAQLHIQNNSTDLPSVIIENAVTFNITQAGLIGVGTANPLAQFHLIHPSSSGTEVVRIEVPSGSMWVPGIHSDGLGHSGFGAYSTINYQLRVGNAATINAPAILAGDNPFTSATPNWAQGSHAFFTGMGENLLMAGLFDNQKDAFVYGGAEPEDFVIKYGGSNPALEVLRFSNEKQVGIGTSVPSASLHITETRDGYKAFFIEDSGSANILVVDQNGVGIGVLFPTSDLTVSGTVRVTDIQDAPVYGTLFVAPTVNVINEDQSPENVIVSARFRGLTDYTNQDIEVVIATRNVKKPLYGIDLDIVSTVSSTATFNLYGLYADVRSLNSDPSHKYEGEGYESGRKFAGIFLGAPFKIGTISTDNMGDHYWTQYAPMEVMAIDKEGDQQATGNIARFTTLQDFDSYNQDTRPTDSLIESQLTLISYKDVSGDYGILFNIGSSTTPNNYIMLLTTDNRSDNVGKVGIGIINTFDMKPGRLSLIDKTLVVSGDIRIGIAAEGHSGAGLNWGNKLYFSGGPHSIGITDETNVDDVYFGRYNTELDTSELRWVMKDAVGEGLMSIVVGTSGFWPSNTDTWVDNVFSIGEFSANNLTKGGVGINIAYPRAALHVYGSAVTENATPTSYAVTIENTVSSNNDDSKCLAIMHFATSTGNLSYYSSNFITFMAQDGSSNIKVLGAIEGDDEIGVQYASPEADYAEYLPKVNPEEMLGKGDVVGVYNGKITKRTAKAQQIMIMSAGPIIAGNWQGKETADHGCVAFLGQVPVKVRGRVSAGDYLIPSNYNDGTAIAVSPEELKALDYVKVSQIVGRAWQSSEFIGVKLIKTIVGFPFHWDSLRDTFSKSRELEQEIQTMKQENEQVENLYQEKLKERQDKINQLKELIQARVETIE